MIIDIHTHTFPSSIAAAAVEKLQAASHTHPFTDGTAQQLRASMQAAGIDAAVELPVATAARQVPHINDAAIRTHAAWKETGVDSFGCMHPNFDDAEREMERLRAAGIRGVKLHPPYQGVDFDDPRYLRILHKAAELDMPVLIHAGLDVGLPGACQATPEKIRRAVDAVPEATLILAHMGGWRCWEATQALLADTGVCLDTSFSLGRMTPSGDGYDWTEETLRLLDPAGFMQMVRAFGTQRILFGTDSPWAAQSDALAAIRSLPLTAQEMDDILGGNARRLLGDLRG